MFTELWFLTGVDPGGAIRGGTDGDVLGKPGTCGSPIETNMSEYTETVVPAAQEPVLAPAGERVKEISLLDLPSDDELRYLGNAKQYCNYELGEIKDCLINGRLNRDKLLFKRCKEGLERLHDCYMLREPSDFKYRNAFMEENETCPHARDVFVKCAFQQAASWATCMPTWTELYRCQFRLQPAKLTFN